PVQESFDTQKVPCQLQKERYLGRSFSLYLLTNPIHCNRYMADWISKYQALFLAVAMALRNYLVKIALLHLIDMHFALLHQGLERIYLSHKHIFQEIFVLR